MPDKKIFPASILEHSSEVTLYNLSKPSYIIYVIVLGVILVSLIAIFFIKVNVTVQTTAQIKPIGQKLVITAPITGKLKFKNITENNSVCAGDTLAIVQAQGIMSQFPALETRHELLIRFIGDLKAILSSLTGENLCLKSKSYISRHQYFISRLKRLSMKKDFVEKDYKRGTVLYNEKVISTVDFEKIKAEYETAIQEVSIYKKEYFYQLESDLITHRNELQDIQTKLRQIQIQNEETIIISPIEGIITKLYGISDGSYTHSGQQIIEISPNGELVAECAVKSKDIGFIYPSQKVKVKLDAFNYNEWGMLEGKVTEIYDDIFISEHQNQAHFKVYCSLDNYKLYLKNGFSGSVRKGMSAYVLFIISRRSLANLLYDKLDNWLNPNVKE